MLNTILGRKLGQTQGFLEDGTRIPMTRIAVTGNVVTQVKTVEKEGYEAVQLGFGETKKADKPTQGHVKKAGLTTTPRFFMESKADQIDGIVVGSVVKVEEVLSAGDLVDITGTSKGKGYAGVVKRHHFKGGPKTHGQSDRHRAPGSIGQSTTPGRVYKGKRMAGRMGVDQVTVKNLEIIELKDGELLVKGLIPGHINSIVKITKKGVNKKHMGLYQAEVTDEVVEKVEEVGESVEEQEAARQEAAAQAKAEEQEEKKAEQSDSNEEKEVATAEKPLEKAQDGIEEKIVDEEVSNANKTESDKANKEVVEAEKEEAKD